MNSVVRQLWEQNTDIVMVDTGNSYEGLCEYVGGKYIAYTEDKPITMNPFNISKRELNIEKIDFLKNLILLIWKGSETQIPELEFRVVEQLVTEYYDFYFNGVQPYPSSQKETLRKNLSTMEKRRGTELTQIHDKVEKLIKGLEERRMALSVKTLSFDSFYEFACERLDQICIENNITTIDCDNFAYMLQNFYRGIHLEDDEGLVEQGAIHVLVENLVVLAATVEVLEHIGEVVAVNGGDIVLDAYLVETLTGKLIERVKRQGLHSQCHAPLLQSVDEFLHLVVYLSQLRATPLLHRGEVLAQGLLL